MRGARAVSAWRGTPLWRWRARHLPTRRRQLEYLVAGTGATPESPAVVSAADFELDGKTACVDVVIVGAGPAGLSLAAAFAEENRRAGATAHKRALSVVVVDPDLARRWVPNYGVWVDEIDSLGIGHCLAAQWPRTTSYFPERVVTSRAYARIDRTKLKQHLMELCLAPASGVRLVSGTARLAEPTEVTGGASESQGAALYTVVVSPTTGASGDDGAAVHAQRYIRSRLVIDTAGHSGAMVRFQQPHEPAFQAAYGIEARVVSHPFPLDEMLLMDYRRPDMQESPADSSHPYERCPTFLYAMPLSESKIFLEETSLVARPPVPFEELKRRLHTRLRALGITVTEVEEEEFCLIPMGGALPDLAQSVVGFGGAAGLVHPSTGYMLSRTLNMARELARQIHNSATWTAPNVWKDMIWTPPRLAQRDFYAFGGEVLMQMSLGELREFFLAFFQLPDADWHDFLSFRQLSGASRLRFGIGVWLRTSWRVKARLVRCGMRQWSLLTRSIIFVE
eukprot:ctg_433.g262